MSEILSQCLPDQEAAVLSGPSHAEEVVRGGPTAVVLGAEQPATAARLQQLFNAATLRAYTSDDRAGIELGGALKNIFAIAAGISDGLGFGDNAKAALVTRSLVELVRLGSRLGGRRETFQGLSGIGDLMVTCFSRHSRNRRVGERLGRGESLATITKSMSMIAEGVPTALSAHGLARRLGLETPVIDQVHAILYKGRAPADGLRALFTRDPRPRTRLNLSPLQNGAQQRILRRPSSRDLVDELGGACRVRRSLPEVTHVDLRVVIQQSVPGGFEDVYL